MRLSWFPPTASTGPNSASCSTNSLSRLPSSDELSTKVASEEHRILRQQRRTASTTCIARWPDLPPRRWISLTYIKRHASGNNESRSSRTCKGALSPISSGPASKSSSPSRHVCRQMVSCGIGSCTAKPTNFVMQSMQCVREKQGLKLTDTSGLLEGRSHKDEAGINPQISPNRRSASPIRGRLTSIRSINDRYRRHAHRSQHITSIALTDQTDW